MLLIRLDAGGTWQPNILFLLEKGNVLFSKGRIGLGGTGWIDFRKQLQLSVLGGGNLKRPSDHPGGRECFQGTLLLQTSMLWYNGTMTLGSILALFSCTLLWFQDQPDFAVAQFVPSKARSGQGKGHSCLYSVGWVVVVGRADGEGMSVLRGSKFRVPCGSND